MCGGERWGGIWSSLFFSWVVVGEFMQVYETMNVRSLCEGYLLLPGIWGMDVHGGA